MSNIYHTVVDILGLNIQAARTDLLPKKILPDEESLLKVPVELSITHPAASREEFSRLNKPSQLWDEAIKKGGIYVFPYVKNTLEQQLKFSLDKYIVPGPRLGFINFRRVPGDYFSFSSESFNAFLERVLSKDAQIANNITHLLIHKTSRGDWRRKLPWDEALELIMKMEASSSIRAWRLAEMTNTMSASRKEYETYPKDYFIKTFGFSLFDYSTEEKRGMPIRIGNNLITRQSVAQFFVRAMEKDIKAAERVYEKFNKQVSAAMMAPDKLNLADATLGGIDFNPAHMSMHVKKEGKDFKFDFNGAKINATQVTGATFTIRTMIPVNNLPQILGLKAFITNQIKVRKA